MSARIATIKPDAVDEFRIIFNSCAKYLGIDVIARIDYQSKNYLQQNSCTSWKQDAHEARVFTIDPKTRRTINLTHAEAVKLRSEVNVAYGGDFKEIIGYWDYHIYATAD